MKLWCSDGCRCDTAGGVLVSPLRTITLWCVQVSVFSHVMDQSVLAHHGSWLGASLSAFSITLMKSQKVGRARCRHRSPQSHQLNWDFIRKEEIKLVNIWLCYIPAAWLPAEHGGCRILRLAARWCLAHTRLHKTAACSYSFCPSTKQQWYNAPKNI